MRSTIKYDMLRNRILGPSIGDPIKEAHGSGIKAVQTSCISFEGSLN